MKKIYTLILLLSVIMVASAQKMTIKTANGQTIEINCEGVTPDEVHVEGDKVVFKMNKKNKVAAKVETIKTDSSAASQFMPVPEEEVVTSSIVNALVEEFDPEYAEFNKKYAGKHPSSEGALIEDIAKNFIPEDKVEKASFVYKLLGGLRFTKDTTFVPQYEQRKPKKSIRTYDIIELSGSIGKDISGVSDAVAEKIKSGNFDDDTENEQKYGANIKYSRVYMSGTEGPDGKWQPNPLGFAWSWGGMLSYTHEPTMGSSFSAFGKLGVQIGNSIAVGADALMGFGIVPYNTFLTNGVNYSTINKSSFCFRYGVQLWGSLNFSRDTYTAFYGRYVASAKPSSDYQKLPDDWDVLLEDFDPSGWSVGLAVGYKFGAPQELSTDKRLQASVSAGYQLIGEKGMLVSAELERMTKVSHSASLSCGVAVEQLYAKDKEGYFSFLLSGGFKVQKPCSKFFWSAKLYAGIGDYRVNFVGEKYDNSLENITKKLCARGAFQLSTGFSLTKCSEIFAACRVGYHTGKAIDTEGFDDSYYQNLSGFEMDTRLGYKLTF